MQHNSRPVITVGSKEYIDLPDFKLEHVPARVDTGANKSAIWASNIRIHNGLLSFNFFAPGSAFYQTTPVTTDAYRSTVVRNSFGAEEFRYMVQLRVSLAERTLRRWFSLADRSNNTYPVLLGRNFLRSRFVVNVADMYVHGNGGQSRSVLILTAFPEENDAFFAKVKAAGQFDNTYTSLAYESLLFKIAGDHSSVVDTVSDTDLSGYDYTYFKNHHDPEVAHAVAEYLHFKGRQFVDHEFADGVSYSKLSEYMRLACHNIPVPDSICAKTALLAQQYDTIEKMLGVPFVLKATTSDKGRNNFLVAKKADFTKILADDSEGLMWLAQRYVPNDGFFRIYVLGQDLALAIWRSAVENANPLKQHLNKPHGGINARLVPLDKVPGEAQKLALQAARCMDRQIAGVDLLQDKTTHKWYILEANNDPQIRSGAFVDEKVRAIAQFFDKELGT